MANCSRCRSPHPVPSCPVCALPDPDREAYSEGQAAAFCGRPRTANPYSLRFASNDHDDWDEGWMNGTEETTKD